MVPRIPYSPKTLSSYEQHHHVSGFNHSVAATVLHEQLFDGEALDRIFRGRGSGVRVLGVTNRRLIMAEADDESHLIVTSIPLRAVGTASLLCGTDNEVSGARSVRFTVMATRYVIHCHSAAEAHELYELLAWSLIE